MGDIMDTLLSEIGTQEEFNDYIRKLPSDKKCFFMIQRSTPLCSNNFTCPYKGRDDYPHRGKRLRECKRDSILRQKHLLR